MKSNFVARVLFPVSVFLCFNSSLSSQSDSEDSFDNLNLLLSPPSPGFLLLGIEPASVERPGNVSDFTLSLAQSTDRFRTLPDNLAIEAAPFWLLKGNEITYEEYASAGKISAVVPQTLALSIATSRSESPEGDTYPVVALGTRFSLLRGRIDEEFHEYSIRLDSLYAVLGKSADIAGAGIAKKVAEDETIQRLRLKVHEAAKEDREFLIPVIEEQINERIQRIHNEETERVRSENSDLFDDARRLATGMKFRRIGWKLDIAGGVVFDFPDGNVESLEVNRWGVWLTGGFEWRSWGVLGVLRYLDAVIGGEDSVVDTGVRVLVEGHERLYISGELVYRSRLNTSEGEHTRITGIIDYILARNIALSFTFGRNYTDSGNGNIIASFGLSFGFGSLRPLW